MEATIQEIVIAGLLHDIGKFAQRAGIVSLRSGDLEGQLCKSTKQGYYTHQHVLYTHGFIEKYQECFPDEVNVRRIVSLAQYHHNPETAEHQIIAKADRLSSGMDRRTDIDLDYEISGKFFERPMLSIASTLHVPETDITADARNETAYLPLRELEGDAILATKTAKISRADYEKQWAKFEKDFTSLKGLRYEKFLSALDTILERYTWCIPSSTIDDPDISLYHHAKTTAAFAACIALYAQKHKDWEKTIDVDRVFLFVQGDISGIQKYIFDLPTTKYNAKLLRARSFQIWSSSLAFAQHISNRFGVNDLNIITFAGGRFLLLLPWSDTAGALIKEIQTELDLHMIKEYSGRLACVLSSTIIEKTSELMQKQGILLQQKIYKNETIAKKKKLQLGLFRSGQVLHDQYDQLQRFSACSLCECNPREDENSYCSQCKNLISIGGLLVKADKIKITPNELTSYKKMVEVVKYDQKNVWGYTNRTYQAGFPLLSLPYIAPNKKDSEDEILTFEELVEDPKTGKKKKLAMFKADIDNLGLIFGSSLGDRWSLSRYADLSYQFHQFFSTFLTHMILSNSTYRSSIYVVFSGGDDLCVLGPWDIIMQFASDFRKHLDAFSNNNKMVTLSGGIELASSSIPVRTLASMTEDTLATSKQRRDRGVVVKDGLTIFGVTLTWSEYDQCIADGKELFRLMNENIVSLGMVYRIIDFSHRAQRVAKGVLRDLLWMSNYQYQINRNIDKKYLEIRKWFLQLGSSPECMIRSRVSASYALYLKRS